MHVRTYELKRAGLHARKHINGIMRATRFTCATRCDDDVSKNIKTHLYDRVRHVTSPLPGINRGDIRRSTCDRAAVDYYVWIQLRTRSCPLPRTRLPNLLPYSLHHLQRSLLVCVPSAVRILTVIIDGIHDALDTTLLSTMVYVYCYVTYDHTTLLSTMVYVYCYVTYDHTTLLSTMVYVYCYVTYDHTTLLSTMVYVYCYVTYDHTTLLSTMVYVYCYVTYDHTTLLSTMVYVYCYVTYDHTRLNIYNK